MWLIVLLNAACGATFTINKILLAFVSPLLLIALRMIIAGGCLLCYTYFSGIKWYFNKKIIVPLLQIAFIGIYFSFILEFWALQYVASAKTALIYNLTPFATAIFSYIYFSERLTIKMLIGLLVGCLGLFPVLIFCEPGEIIVGQSIGFLSMPEIALLIAVVAYAFGWIPMRQLVRQNVSSSFINGTAMFASGILALITSIALEGIQPILRLSALPLWPFWVWLAVIIVVGNIIFYNLYGFLLQSYSMTFLAFTGFTIPFFTAIYSYFLLGESIGLDFYIASLLVGLGLYIFYQEELRHGIIKNKGTL